MIEASFCAQDDIHSILSEHKSKNEYEFVLTCSDNGKKVSSKLKLSIVGMFSSEPPSRTIDGLKEVMQRSIQDALRVAGAFSEVQLQSEGIRSISLTLFIQRSRR